MRKKLHEIDIRKVDRNLYGLMAYVNAYNKCLHILPGGAPVLHINWVDQNTQPELRRAKNSYVVNVNPRMRLYLGDIGHDIIHMLTVNLAKHFAPKERTAQTATNPSGEHRNNLQNDFGRNMNIFKKMKPKVVAGLASILGRPPHQNDFHPRNIGVLKDKLKQLVWDGDVGPGEHVAPEVAAAGQILNAFSSEPIKNYFKGTANTPKVQISNLFRGQDLKQHTEEEELGNKLLDRIFSRAIVKAEPIDIGETMGRESNREIFQKLTWLPTFMQVFNRELEKMNRIIPESLSMKGWFKF